MEVSKVRRGLYVGWILLHQGWGRWGLSALPWCSWSFLPWCRGGSHVAIYGWTLMSSRARTQTQVFLTWKIGKAGSKCIAIFPNMSKCIRGEGERGGRSTYPYMMQPRVGNSRLPGAQTQTLASHEGWGCSQKKKRIWASSYPGSCFWAPLYLHMGHESALISAVSSWV